MTVNLEIRDDFFEIIKNEKTNLSKIVENYLENKKVDKIAKSVKNALDETKEILEGKKPHNIDLLQFISELENNDN